MLLSCEDHGPILVLTVLKARIDSQSAMEFKAEAREFLSTGDQDCALDLSRVSFADSSGIGALVALLKFMGRDRKLELCGMNPAVAKVMRLTRLDTVFISHDSVKSALANRGLSATGT
ncbi:MAG: STAS domain-containing protein [Paracoccaceae bacterium]